MDKDRIAAIAAIAERGEQIKTNSAEFLWVCCGIRPPFSPGRPVLTDRGAADHPDDLQLQLQARPLARTARLTRKLT
jgi:hypothetical protein